MMLVNIKSITKVESFNKEIRLILSNKTMLILDLP